MASNRGDEARADADTRGEPSASTGPAADESPYENYVSWPRAALLDGNADGDMPWSVTRWLTTLAIPLALLLGVGTWWGVAHIEGDIEAAAEAILQERGIDTSTLTFHADHRNVDVRGVLPEGVIAGDIERIIEDGHGPGGEDIRSATIFATASAPALGPIYVTATTDGQILTLTGNIPSDAHRQQLIDATAGWGEDRVVDNLAVSGLDPSSADPSGQVASMAELLSILDGRVISADIALGDDGPVTGTIVAIDAETEAEIRAVAGIGIAVTSPAPLGSLDVSATFDGTRIVLDGEVLSPAQRDLLVSAASEVAGRSNVLDNLAVLGLEPAVEGADDKTAAAGAILGAFAGLNFGDLQFDDTDLTLNGEAVDDEAKAVLDAALEAAETIGLRPGGELTVAEPELTLQEEIDLLQAELDALQDEIRKNVVFTRSSNRLSELAEGTLDKVVDAMNRYMRPVVEVGGHTDSRGSTGFNTALSQRRAEAVVNYLISQGIGAERLNPVGYGESDPIADNTTEEGRLRNRRVEFLARASF